jgi:hypothetical protein
LVAYTEKRKREKVRNAGKEDERDSSMKDNNEIAREHGNRIPAAMLC